MMETIDTEKIFVDLDKICRACMTDEGEMTSVFNKLESEDIRIVDMLDSCSILHITEEDTLPTQICLVCYGLAYQAYTFKVQCQKSETIMKSYLSEEGDHIKIVKFEEVLTDLDDETAPEIILEEGLSQFEIVEKTENECDNTNNEEITVDYEIDLSYACDNCNTICKDADQLELHKVECLVEFQKPNRSIKYSCTTCFRKFKYEEAYKAHFITCCKFQCELCGNLLKSARSLENHMKIHDPLGSLIDKKYKCHICDKSYTSTSNLTIHLYSHTGIKPYKCEYCARGFTKLIALNSHMATHTGNKEHLCSECGRGFTSAAILTQHKKIHTGERPYKCRVCPKSYTTSGDLTIHVRSHTGEKPYLCTTCGKAFARVTHLNTHVRTHTGERPYVCQECGKGFAQSGDLRSHQRTHTGERPYVCKICGKSFIQSSGLSAHMTTHSGIKSHICGICNRAFSQSSSLARHLKAHE